MKYGLPLLLCLFGALVPSISSYNILVMFPLPGRSHFNSFALLFKTLAQKGHNVTVISFFPLKENVPNYRDIPIRGLEELINFEESDMFDMKNIPSKSRLFMYFQFYILGVAGEKLCELGFSSKPVQDFLKEKNHFDIAIMEYFNSDCFLTVAKKFNVPVIRIHSSIPMPWTTGRYGIPPNPAYVPNNFLHFSDRMSFSERVENTVLTVIHSAYYYCIMLQNEKSVSIKHFGELGASLDSDVFNDSLLLIQMHHSLNFPQPLVPNIIEVGGLHVEKPKALPKDIEKWINESEHGVIYFSMGSVVKGRTMPAEKRQAFINAFKNLPQRIIWKWENDSFEGKPDNIMTRKWLPQFDILSHPNVKAFISHGGLLGTIEAVHNGVPMIVIPVLGDQNTNAKALQAAGGGDILYLDDATEESIHTALSKILNPAFQNQAKQLSERFRDRPMPPLETAVYWVEYVARHKGAHFMKTAAVGMPFYQYYLLDVIAFLLFIVSVLFFGIYLFLRMMIRLVFYKKTSQKVKRS